MRANAKDATMFSKFYKTVADEIQPSLSNPDSVALGKNITLTVSGYTEAWKNANNLYDVTDAKTEIINYTITPDSQSDKIATLEIPTSGFSMGTRMFRFEPKTTGGAYNPITFTAEITEPEKEYTISFDDTSIESKVFTESAIPIGGITLPAAEKTGYTFEGWYKENTFVNEISSPITAANLADIFGEGTSVTLYAKRTPITYNITYHNTDEAENSNPGNYTIETETITLSAPQKTGYDFDGWYTDAGFSASATEIPQGSTGAKDFYAKWTAKTYTIIYNKDGGTIGNENNYTSYTYGAGLTLPKPARDGFYFNGWYDNEQLSGDPVSAVLATDTENKTFWAKWTENEPTEYQIIFVDYNGTELKKGMVNVGEIPSCEEPAREQDDKYTYTFAG